MAALILLGVPDGFPCVMAAFSALPAAREKGMTHIRVEKGHTCEFAVDELTKLYGIPQEAVLGGAETALPEFRKKIKDKYVRPSKCVSVPVSTCGGPGTYPPID